MDILEREPTELRAQVVLLEQHVRLLLGIVRLLFTVLRIFDVRLDDQRVPSGEAESNLLAAIEHARASIKLSVILRVIHLSPSRYHAWANRKKACALDDRPTCPCSSPTMLTPPEIRTMRDMATSTEHRHMSVRALALCAARAGRVFAAVGTWLRLIRERTWRRPRLRIHPASPSVGVRAARPNMIPAGRDQSGVGGDGSSPERDQAAGIGAAPGMQLLRLQGRKDLDLRGRDRRGAGACADGEADPIGTRRPVRVGDRELAVDAGRAVTEIPVCHQRSGRPR